MPNSGQTKELLSSQIFGVVLPDLMIEAIVDQSPTATAPAHVGWTRKPRQHRPLAFAVARIRLRRLQPVFLVRFVFQARARRSEQRHNLLPRC